MMNLQQVRLAKTDLEELPEDFFKHSTNIIRIELSRLQLESIPKNVFVAQSMLIDLNLSNNLLKELTDGTFDTTINMISLNLSYNNLTSISRYVIRIKTMINELNYFKLSTDIYLQSLENWKSFILITMHSKLLTIHLKI